MGVLGWLSSNSLFAALRVCMKPRLEYEILHTEVLRKPGENARFCTLSVGKKQGENAKFCTLSVGRKPGENARFCTLVLEEIRLECEIRNTWSTREG